MNHNFFRSVVVTLQIAMFILFIAFALLLVRSLPAAATEEQEAYISEVGYEAVSALAEEAFGVYDPLTYELHDIAQDPDVSPECQLYADVSLATLVLMEEWGYYPESQALAALNQSMLETWLPEAQFNCNVAL